MGKLLQECESQLPSAAHPVRLAAEVCAPWADSGRDDSPPVAASPGLRWKRAMDIRGAAAGLLLALPLLAAAALLVKLTSRGDVIYRQARAGLHGKPFVMFKIRTMAHDADQRKAELLKLNERDGPAFKLRNDPRVTRVGKFLRRTSLDELPQLWNVLKGDMSLVGPRPLPCDESGALDDRQRRRLAAKPGITCIWQITARAERSFEDWLRLDLQYIRQRSPLLDLKILLLTIPAVIFRGDAS
jgi:lipopolysaccharide/colanic/teichoic acid biosynthesis glycosyltransferase